jgi:Ethanolamine utilization protein EutJ (predicted chaperonin)
MDCNLIEQVKARIKSQYNWLSEEEVKNCYDMALSDFLAVKYPSENSRPVVDKLVFDFFNSQWIYKRMVDILERAGGISLTAYKENGLNLTYGGSYIDPQLVAQIMPKAGVPR